MEKGANIKYILNYKKKFDTRVNFSKLKKFNDMCTNFKKQNINA